MADITEAKEKMKALYGVNRCLEEIPEGAPCVRCSNGIFAGEDRNGIHVFKGIPFARAPIGKLRWKAPEAPEKSDIIREALYFGPSPLQTELFSEMGSLYEQSEDCLYLNIWVNSVDESSDKPVMVFFHGGSYGWGGTSDPLYEGTNFVSAHPDIILVTAAYRTGIMGFMDFSSVPGGKAFEDSCNLGLLDQIAGLKWVQKNIERFGGNRANVTIFGESAGGGSVSILPVMPLAKGLFSKAIAESGSIALTFSRQECQPLTELLLEKSGCSSMDELMALSTEQLKDINEYLNESNNFPMRDGRLVPEDLYEAYRRGDAGDIIMINGVNAHEANYWVSELGGIVPYALQIPVLFENNLKRLSPKDLKRVNAFMD